MRTDWQYRSRIREKYNGIGQIWDATDRWHSWIKSQIDSEMQDVLKDFLTGRTERNLVVDVGCGGNSYLNGQFECVGVDLAQERLRQTKWAVCGNAERLPLASEIADLTICVGPVINYCSLEEALLEIARVTKRGGVVVLHVELSNSIEFLGTKAFRADAAFVTTFYKGDERYWVYSDDYVRRMIEADGLILERVRSLHLLSSFIYRLTRQPNLSARFAVLDRVFQLFSLGRQVADSGIFVCRRA